MKIQYYLLPAVVMFSTLYADEPVEVRELATTYMTLRNQKKNEEIIAKCLCRDRVTDKMLQNTRQILGFGVKIQSFKIVKATSLDKQLFQEGVVLGDQVRLYSNLDPEWAIVYSCQASGATPASTERVAVGKAGDKWLISMLSPKKN